MTLSISESLRNQICNYGSTRFPEEATGLILGTADKEIRNARVILPLENSFQAESRRNRYLIDPREMLFAEQEAERLDLEVIGVFHSHPNHPARPSEFDLQRALPWYSYFITSIFRGEVVESRSWRLAEDRSSMIEELIEVIQPTPLEVN